MIKANKAEAKVQSIRSEEVNKNRIDIEIIKNDVKNLRESTEYHNRKTDEEFTKLHNKIDKIDSRLWWVAGIIIAATLGPLIASMIA